MTGSYCISGLQRDHMDTTRTVIGQLGLLVLEALRAATYTCEQSKHIFINTCTAFTHLDIKYRNAVRRQR